MEGIKVVSAEEMVRLEQGGDPERYMAEAGRRVAEAVIGFVETHRLAKQATLLVGKGNNGGDAYAAGIWLLGEGYRVHAYALYEKGGALNERFREEFRKKGGRFAEGLEGVIVEVEVDIAPGLPKFFLVGLPDEAVQEARERARAAVDERAVRTVRDLATKALGSEAPSAARRARKEFGTDVE